MLENKIFQRMIITAERLAQLIDNFKGTKDEVDIIISGFKVWDAATNFETLRLAYIESLGPLVVVCTEPEIFTDQFNNLIHENGNICILYTSIEYLRACLISLSGVSIPEMVIVDFNKKCVSTVRHINTVYVDIDIVCCVDNADIWCDDACECCITYYEVPDLIRKYMLGR